MNKTKKMEKKTIDLRTHAEIERDKKHDRICADFLSLKQGNPDVSVYRLFTVIANNMGMTQMGVMRVLQRRKLYHIQRMR